MPTPRKLPLAAYDRILEVMHQRAAIPSDKELARELDCSLSLIRSAMDRVRMGKRILRSRETLADALADLSNQTGLNP